MEHLLNYTEYQTMGGTLQENIFNKLRYDVEAKVNHLTNGRILELDTVPDAVKQLIFKLLDVYSTFNNNSAKSAFTGEISSYSNGIETFSFANDTENGFKGSTPFDKKIYAIMREYLWNYPELLYRGKSRWKRK